MLLKVPGLPAVPLLGPRDVLRQLRDTLASVRDPNRAGQAYGFLAFAPVAPGHGPALRAALDQVDSGPSPFLRLPRTHFARWVVLTEFAHDPPTTYQPLDEDQLGCEYLLFSACFDGDRDSYLTELADELAPEAQRLWGHCTGVDAGSPEDLVRYLRHNQVDCGLFYSAYPHTTVAEVQRVLQQQRALRALAVQRHDLSPAALQAAFVEELAGP
jgi:hypothetical protein